MKWLHFEQDCAVCSENKPWLRPLSFDCNTCILHHILALPGLMSQWVAEAMALPMGCEGSQIFLLLSVFLSSLLCPGLFFSRVPQLTVRTQPNPDKTAHRPSVWETVRDDILNMICFVSKRYRGKSYLNVNNRNDRFFHWPVKISNKGHSQWRLMNHAVVNRCLVLSLTPTTLLTLSTTRF